MIYNKFIDTYYISFKLHICVCCYTLLINKIYTTPFYNVPMNFVNCCIIYTLIRLIDIHLYIKDLSIKLLYF